MGEALASLILLALIVGAVTLTRRIAHAVSDELRRRKLPRVTEWQARKNAAPLTSAITHIESAGPGPVSVTRDHRGLPPNRPSPP
jgi:hypothetical protein